MAECRTQGQASASALLSNTILSSSQIIKGTWHKFGNIVTWRLKTGVVEPEETSIARQTQSLGKYGHGSRGAQNQEWLRWEGQQQTTIPEQTRMSKVVGRELHSVISREHGSREISIFRSRYQGTTTSEDIEDWEDLVCAVVICRVCRLVKVLQLFVVTSYKRSPIINPNPASNH
jgi:hypothetical protein